jgi:hypothetical protein
VAPSRCAATTYLTVSSPDDERLEEDCAEIVYAAERAGLSLRVRRFEQGGVVPLTLPLCLGLPESRGLAAGDRPVTEDPRPCPITPGCQLYAGHGYACWPPLPEPPKEEKP